MNVDQIDTEAPVDAQLAGVKDTANQIWEYMQAEIDTKIDEVLDAGSDS